MGGERPGALGAIALAGALIAIASGFVRARPPVSAEPDWIGVAHQVAEATNTRPPRPRNKLAGP